MVHSLPFARGYSNDFTLSPGAMLCFCNRMQPQTSLIATEQVPIHAPGQREAQFCVNTLPKGANMEQEENTYVDMVIHYNFPFPMLVLEQSNSFHCTAELGWCSSGCVAAHLLRMLLSIVPMVTIVCNCHQLCEKSISYASKASKALNPSNYLPSNITII